MYIECSYFELWLSIIGLFKGIGLIILINIDWICDDYELELNLNRVWVIFGSVVIFPELKGFIVFALYLPFTDVPWLSKSTRRFWIKIQRSC